MQSKFTSSLLPVTEDQMYEVMQAFWEADVCTQSHAEIWVRVRWIWFYVDIKINFFILFL